VEVLNFGVNGYGLDQMVINYEKFVNKYNPDLVIVQLYSFNAFRTLYTSMWLTQKPTFEWKNNQLLLKNHPVPRNRYKKVQTWLINHSYLYTFLLDQSLRISETVKIKVKNKIQSNRELHTLTAELLKYLKKLTGQNNAELIVFVNKDWLEEITSSSEVDHIKIFPINNLPHGEDGSFYNPNPVRHWNLLGNKFVAQAILNYLRDKNIGGLFVK